MTQLPQSADVIIIGGGFYGACLALFYRSVAENVVVLEERGGLLERASYVNQARIHTGFHYPRNFKTARRSLSLYQRFIADFPSAVFGNFTMLYAVARHGSRVTPQRFEKMFTDLGAPIERANPTEVALFNPAEVAQVWRCQEYAFNAAALRKDLEHRLAQQGVSVAIGAKVVAVTPDGPDAPIRVAVDGHGEIRAPIVIDATYGHLAGQSDSGNRLGFKYELAEVALIDPPAALEGVGVTMMDGPFFSTMPFPAEDAYSLTHVRYTPHRAWLAGQAPQAAACKSHWMHMLRDASRYLPSLSGATWRKSLYETKTVLLRNERDDGRPILLDRDPRHPGLMMVMGGKIDNIYDLFERLQSDGGLAQNAHTRFIERGGVA
ncbi:MULTISPECIES: FAD-binding oxidoreductase [unclassified Ruegeria]|uniref:NAD(P)/FAD-dependent oxidoreductase n=1 Tax=unclassified Ruegeria TaxID=2625375 RepID=UPI0014883C75|nr:MULTISPECIES: FAD-dependent oxidoreductase [unclassified Ruegeria]